MQQDPLELSGVVEDAVEVRLAGLPGGERERDPAEVGNRRASEERDPLPRAQRRSWMRGERELVPEVEVRPVVGDEHFQLRICSISGEREAVPGRKSHLFDPPAAAWRGAPRTAADIVCEDNIDPCV